MSDGEVMLLQTAREVHSFQGDFEGKGSYETEGAVWRGELITEGGGFCGARTKVGEGTLLVTMNAFPIIWSDQQFLLQVLLHTHTQPIFPLQTTGQL